MILLNVNLYLLTGNLFFEAFYQSDLMGRTIFLALIAISVGTWALLVQKIILTLHARKVSAQFKKKFTSHKENLLSLDEGQRSKNGNSFVNLYSSLKSQTVELLNKNHHFGSDRGRYLSVYDIDVVETYLSLGIAEETRFLEKNLYILATVVPLAPFLGLLGTVWGILTSFSEMQVQSSGSTNQMVLGGLSLALTTTVLGLVDAIPALIGYNYLKSSIRDFQTEMESFSHEMITSVELQYRKID